MVKPRLPGGRAVLVTDLLAAAWVLLWIVLGLVVADAVRELTGLTDGFDTIGKALDDAADAVGGLELPLVGGGLDGAAESLRGAGRDVAASGESNRGTIERTATVLGLAVALVPSLPLVIGYLPPRLGRARETTALRRLVRDGDGDPALDRFLAHRAAETLTYRELRRVSIPGATSRRGATRPSPTPSCAAWACGGRSVGRRGRRGERDHVATYFLGRSRVSGT